MGDQKRRETITRSAEATYVHKKILGGRGEFAFVTLRLEPLSRNAGFEFIDDTGFQMKHDFVVGVHDGISSGMENGVVDGGQVVDLKARLLEARYHEVDSTRAAFASAAREALRKAGPIVLLR